MKAVEGWSNKKLSELAEYINGYAFKPDDWEKDGLPIIRIEQLKNPDAPTDYYSGKLPTKNIIENGDLIFSWSASLFLRIWRHDKAVLNQHLFRVVEREGIDRVFLKLFIEFYLPELVKASHGSTMQHITRKELDRFGAPFPTSKPEQTKIAEILSTVDRAIEQTEAIIAKQQRIKTGLMQDLLTRGIDEHGNIRSEETHEFKDSPLGRIPVEWGTSTLGKLAEFLSGYAFKNQELSEHGWRVVRISNLHKHNFPFWYYDGPVKPSWIIESDDILFSWAGVASSIDCIRYDGPKALMNQHIYNLKFATDQLKTYIFYFLQSYLPRLRTKIEGGAGQLHLTKAKIQSIDTPQLKDYELKRTVEVLEKVEETLNGYLEQLTKMKSLKTALMQDLLTGKKRVTALLNDTEVVHG